MAKFRGRMKHPEGAGVFHQFFDTDYGLCTFIRPTAFFDDRTNQLSFSQLMRLPPIHQDVLLGKENGLVLYLDAEVG